MELELPHIFYKWLSRRCQANIFCILDFFEKGADFLHFPEIMETHKKVADNFLWVSTIYGDCKKSAPLKKKI